jgi:hypothetical protein
VLVVVVVVFVSLFFDILMQYDWVVGVETHPRCGNKKNAPIRYWAFVTFLIS